MVALWENLRPEVDGFKILALPDFETFVADEKVEKYPYKLTWEESKHDPVFIVHTSGSTGKSTCPAQALTLTLYRPSKADSFYFLHDVHLQSRGLLAEVAKLESSCSHATVLVFGTKLPNTSVS
jgi:hypothetical protein